MREVAVRILLGGLLFIAATATCVAQQWPFWADELYGRRTNYERPRPTPEKAPSPLEQPRSRDGDIRDGGARPETAPVAPPRVAFPHEYPANSIVIDTGG